MFEREFDIASKTLAFARDVVMKHFSRTLSLREVRYKSKENLEIVTTTDRMVEDLIVGILKNEFPEYGIWSEESGRFAGDSELFWLLDPLDGTKNFLRKFPSFAISLALVNPQIPLMGIAMDPIRKEMFWAIKDKGSFRNKRRIFVSQKTRLEGAMFACGIPFRARHNLDLFEQMFRHLFLKGAGIRKTGCTALEMCYTAMGRLDGLWVFQQAPWDYAAGWIIMEEAGGMFATFEGKNPNWQHQNIVGGNPSMFEYLLNLLSSFSSF